MAKAIVHEQKKIVEKVISEVIIEKTIVLELTEAEAQVIACIAGAIGGRPNSTARGLMENIWKELGSKGICSGMINPLKKYMRDEIHFSKFNDEDMEKFGKELPPDRYG